VRGQSHPARGAQRGADEARVAGDRLAAGVPMRFVVDALADDDVTAVQPVETGT
jgi:hypothetical protein